MCVRARMGYPHKLCLTVGNRMAPGFLCLKVCLIVRLTVGIMNQNLRASLPP